ncbi:MAG: biotin--[acetyl-CoA-carboxylase] ligase [Acidimicrobiia bacterium]|nr:biotin--[acetyl-CoA-carboxylase] ligase [Acidimicrobiia bacterium]
MATPYLQNIHEGVVSTQDLARGSLDRLPVVVIAASQSEGRGRTGSGWVNAPRALAVSMAWRSDDDTDRPHSLVAGLAAVRAVGDVVRLKWPNDVMIGERKVGGILVERAGSVVVAGLGLNLYWPDAPDGIGAVYETDPGDRLYAELSALWAAEFHGLIESAGWPIEEYRAMCQTLGRDISWEPNGRGLAAGVTAQGALLVETQGGIRELFAGAIRHVRGTAPD